MNRIPAKIREIEANVLDKHHESQPLLQQSKEMATTHLLKIYDNTCRNFIFISAEWSTNRRMYESQLWNKALEQSLRWVAKYCVSNNSLSEASWSVLDDEALSLMRWSREYIKLCNAHVAASRGYHSTSCNERLHEIVFGMKGTDDFTILTSQVASSALHQENWVKAFPEKEISNIFENWKSKINLDNWTVRS
ncbi:MAG: hypothetical protein AAF821_21910 [Cyanobacteria bacterium P01_D01_bin.156]